MEPPVISTQQVPQTTAQLAHGAPSLKQFLASPERWVAEEKLDGIRALVRIESGSVTVTNRHGQDKGRGLKNSWLSSLLLEMFEPVWPLLEQGTILDGELVADTWNQTMHQLARNGPGLRFVVFDLPFVYGQDVRDQPWSRRRAMLEQLFAKGKSDIERITLSPLMELKEELIDEIWNRGGEGVMIKDRQSPYLSGGREGWFKIKEVCTADAVVLGYRAGQGKYSDTVGAIQLGQYRNGQLIEVAFISGMDDKTRRALGPDDIGRVIEFKYHQRTIDRYRHPRFLRWRDDKGATDCVWEATE